MDVRRIDEFARLLATGASRRDVVRFAGVALGLAVAGRAVHGAAQQEACDDATPCADGYECVEGVCLGQHGSNCSSDDDCLAELICNDAGACERVAPSCESDDDCTAGICCGGFCIEIACCIEDENPNDRCGDNETCFEGVCQFTCRGDDRLCGDGECCCPDGTCSADCCGDGALPDTGVGPGATTQTLLMAGTTVAIGALLAGRRLQPNEARVRKP